MRGRCLTAVLMLLAGCSEKAAPPAPPPALWTAEQPLCDAGDEAFVRRAIDVVWRRGPESVGEIQVLLDRVRASGRVELVRAMTRSTEYRDAWAEELLQILGVARVSLVANPGCFGRPVRDAVDTALAVHVRDAAPEQPAPGGPWTMADLTAAALALDDLRPLLTANLLFSLVPDFEIPDASEDGEIRRHRANTFTDRYLGRTLECVGCHSASYSTTDSPDPHADRFWPVPGVDSSALLPRSVSGLYPYFRRVGVVAGLRYRRSTATEAEMAAEFAAGLSPWGAAAHCGRFLRAASVAADDRPEQPFGLAGGTAATPEAQASIWTLHDRLSASLAAITALGPPSDTSPSLTQWAWLVAQSFANDVWNVAFGSRLTVAHGFPRNQAQMRILGTLARLVVAQRFSLRELLVAVLTHPLANAGDAARCPQGDAVPSLPPVLAPFRVADGLTEEGNDPMDLVRRRRAHVLLRTLSHALGWPDVALFPIHDGGPEVDFQQGIGAFFKPADPGNTQVDLQTLLWLESTLGTCRAPRQPTACALDPLLEDPSFWLRISLCAVPLEAICEWDSRCCALNWTEWCAPVTFGTTPAVPEVDYDFSTFPRPPTRTGPDLFAELAQAARSGHVTWRQAVLTIKDALLGRPATTPSEDAALTALLGHPLDAPYAGDDASETSLRRFCGTLVRSAPFLLTPTFDRDMADTPYEPVLTRLSRAAACARAAAAGVVDPATCGP